MAIIPGRFKRLAAAFDNDGDMGRLCESSGSEHSPATSLDLSDLVNSFIERENRVIGDNEGIEGDKEGNGLEPESDMELKETLRGLVSCGDDEIRKRIHAEAEQAHRVTGDASSPEFKRRLMASLRQRGFDAGLCKSKWERNGRSPSGSHEYIDINAPGARYVIDINLAGEFEIARPTVDFATLLQLLPQIFVGKLEDVKQIVRLMCNAVKKSMTSMDMHVPPWRQYKYMQAKWLSYYKRTTNEVAEKKVEYPADGACKRSVGFAPFRPGLGNCREILMSKPGGVKIGHLAMAMNNLF